MWKLSVFHPLTMSRNRGASAANTAVTATRKPIRARFASCLVAANATIPAGARTSTSATTTSFLSAGSPRAARRLAPLLTTRNEATSTTPAARGERSRPPPTAAAISTPTANMPAGVTTNRTNRASGPGRSGASDNQPMPLRDASRKGPIVRASNAAAANPIAAALTALPPFTLLVRRLPPLSGLPCLTALRA